MLPRLLGRRRGRWHVDVATELAGGRQRRSALGARMAGLCRIVADGVRRAVVGRVGDASLVRGIGWAGDAMRGGRGRRRCVRRRREMRSRCRSAVVVVEVVVLVMVGVKSWRPSWIHSAEVLAASSKSATRACGAIQRRSIGLCLRLCEPNPVCAKECEARGTREATMFAQSRAWRWSGRAAE